MSAPAHRDDAAAVLDFWFGAPGSAEHGSARKVWFAKNDAFDAQIRERLGSLLERALRGELDDWGQDPSSALAHVLVLDQLTRNAFRGTPRAFAGDPRALAAASRMVGLRQDEELATFMRGFVYLPFEHAEDPAMQQRSVQLFSALASEHGDGFAESLDYAERHLEVIRRFGRFPHRNAILGRAPRPAEIEAGEVVPW